MADQSLRWRQVHNQMEWPGKFIDIDPLNFEKYAV